MNKKEHTLLLEHLRCIKAIINGKRYTCKCEKGRRTDKAEVDNQTKDNSNIIHTPLFGSKKIVPIVLEEEEINR